jgi:hypothetical protein
MFTIIALVVALFVLIAAMGLPYQQSWHARWGNYDR